VCPKTSCVRALMFRIIHLICLLLHVGAETGDEKNVVVWIRLFFLAT
jgi:hypothetical protein